MRKIAISGMKGRKKDTFLLSFVVGLAFVFIIVATIFHASSEGTKIEQRTAMFGSWDIVYLGGNQEIIDEIKGKPEVEKVGISRLLGRSSTVGLVGTIDQSLGDLGNFTMYEGRMPENDNEIVLELNQLSHFSSDVKVGDTIPVELVIPLYERDEYDARVEQVIRVLPEVQKKYGFRNILHEINNFNINYMNYYEKQQRGELTERDRHPTDWIYYISYGYAKSYIRNEQSLESFDDTKVIIKSSYIHLDVTDNYGSFMTNPLGFTPPDSSERPESEVEEISLEDMTMLSQKAHITRNMVVTGIIQNYSNLWDVGDEPVANAFVTEGAGENFINNGFLLTEKIDTSEYEIRQNIFIDSNISSKDFFTKYEKENTGLRRNTYAYPETAGDTESTLTYGILAAIFMATVFAVFQIYLTQTNRRTRRIVLLKSIGAINEQIRSILVWETVYLLLFTLPISMGIGFGISKAVLWFMNTYGDTVINLHIDYKLTAFGIVLGICAVFIGMIVPMVKSMKVPLTGNISTPTRKKTLAKGKLKAKIADLNMNIQTFRKISVKNIRYNKGKTMLTAGLYAITTTVLLGSIFLCFIFFSDYIDNIIVKDKPSYGYEFNHALTNRSIPELLESIYEVEGVSRVEIYKSGEHAYLWHENIGKNEIYPEFRNILGKSKFINKHFGVNDTGYVNLNDDNKYLVEDAVVANIYGIDVDDPLYNRFEDSLTLGKLDKEKFKSGKEVILLLPAYQKKDGNPITEISDEMIANTIQKNRIGVLLRNSNKFDLTYDFRYAENYRRDESISVGDKIHLTIPTENLEGDAKTNDVKFVETKVAGIIHYFPEKSIWPFGDTIENPVVVGSYGFVGDTHPATVLGKGRMSVEDVNNLIARLMPTRYGKTLVYIYEDKKTDEVNVDVNLKRIARENETKINNYKEENKKIYGKAFNMSAIIVILGISVAVITLIILYNTTLSKLEQERERIGTFQALGVTKGQFKGLYIFSGIAYGIFALAISHILLGMAVVATFIGGKPSPLYLYPWKVHGIASLIVFIIITLTYYMPLRKIIKNQPIENIRNLGR